jgi:hypothetical protein
MPSSIPGVPEPTEYAASFAGYIGRARAFTDPLAKLTVQREEVQTLLGPLSETQQLHRYAPDKWSVKQMLGHLIDAECIFSYRALRIGRGDQTPLAGFDEKVYVANAQTESCAWPELLHEFDHVRKSAELMLRHLPEAAWTRQGVSNNATISVRALVYIMIGHVAHHLDILRERYL